MKKILSLFVSVLMAGTMLADYLEHINFSHLDIYEEAQVVSSYTGEHAVITFISESPVVPAKYYSGAIRVYCGGKFTISFTTDEYTLTSVEFSYGGGDYANTNEIIPSVGSFDGYQWSGSARELTFTIGPKEDGTQAGHRRIASMSIRYEKDEEEGPTGIDPSTNVEAYLGIAISTLGQFVRNPDVYGEWKLIYPRRFEANEEISVLISNYSEVFNCPELDAGCKALAYYPAQNEYCYIGEKDWYEIYFRPNRDGGDDWCRGCIKLARMTQGPDPTNCYEAALFVGQEDVEVPYNNGKKYTLEGYVMEVKEPYQDQYKNISFWISDKKDDTWRYLEVFRAECPKASHAVVVGDKVRVTGSLMKYNNFVEFRQGCTYEILNRKEEDQEAIDNAPLPLPAVKTIENGLLQIERNGVKYNALGQIID